MQTTSASIRMLNRIGPVLIAAGGTNGTQTTTLKTPGGSPAKSMIRGGTAAGETTATG